METSLLGREHHICVTPSMVTPRPPPSEFLSQTLRPITHHRHLPATPLVPDSPNVIAVDPGDEHLPLVVVDEESSNHGDAVSVSSVHGEQTPVGEIHRLKPQCFHRPRAALATRPDCTNSRGSEVQRTAGSPASQPALLVT